jgi:DNA-binding response OmpR family regulator
MQILLVEDEPRVASFLRQGLQEESFDVEWVRDGSLALETVARHAPDLLLLDVRLPDISGVEVCQRIRLHQPHLPILMLTALDSIDDRVAGLRAGADDYLPKPFAFAELLARIDALLRRSRLNVSDDLLADGPLELSPLARTCTFRGQLVPLTQTEFDLLAYLLARRGQAASRESIHRGVWGYDFDRGTNLIDVYVGYVRRKLHEAGCASRVETVRGFGYRYVPSGAEASDIPTSSARESV